MYANGWAGQEGGPRVAGWGVGDNTLALVSLHPTPALPSVLGALGITDWGMRPLGCLLPPFTSCPLLHPQLTGATTTETPRDRARPPSCQQLSLQMPVNTVDFLLLLSSRPNYIPLQYIRFNLLAVQSREKKKKTNGITSN